MTARDVINIFQISQNNIHRKRTRDSCHHLLEHLEKHFTDSDIEAITPDQIYQFLEALTEHAAKSTIPVVTVFLWKWYQMFFSGTRISRPLRCIWGKSSISKNFLPISAFSRRRSGIRYRWKCFFSFKEAGKASQM